MKKIVLYLLLLLATGISRAQDKATESEVIVNTLIKGTLFTPANATAGTPLVILIAGSGPTNRSGNQVGMINNSLRLLSQDLAADGIAAFSYDKRIIAQMIAGKVDEKSLRFEDFIHDAEDVVAYFRNQKKYGKIIIAGHSEGALIGMVAAQKDADGYISIAGAGRPIDGILAEQIGKQMPSLKDDVVTYLERIKKGATVDIDNPMLASVFRRDVQPYMASWMKYDPTAEIKKLHVPILIVNGTKDLQVPASDAEKLHQAAPGSKLVIVEKMNHVFKDVDGDDAANAATYNNADLPVNKELTAAVKQFVKSI